MSASWVYGCTHIVRPRFTLCAGPPRAGTKRTSAFRVYAPHSMVHFTVAHRLKIAPRLLIGFFEKAGCSGCTGPEHARRAPGGFRPEQTRNAGCDFRLED